MVTENNNFSLNAYHSFANDKVISKCKNDKSFLKFSDSPLSVEVIRIYFPPALKRMRGGGGGGGGGDYAK